MYILSFDDEERVSSVLGPFSTLEKAQEYAEKDHNASLQWGQADIYINETWMSDENSYGAYYTIVKFEMDPEYTAPVEAPDRDEDIPEEWPPINPVTGLRPPPMFEPWTDLCT